MRRRITTWTRRTRFFRWMGIFFPAGIPGFVLYARQFASRRNPELKEKMSRFYCVESTPTNTGGKADHRLPVRASEVEQVARAIAAGLGVEGGTAQNQSRRSSSPRW